MAQTIGLVVNHTKANAEAIASRLIAAITRCQGQPIIEARTAEALGRPDLAVTGNDFAERADMIFVLGGDGTLLGAARRFSSFNIPMLGINIGHLGFLSEAEPQDLEMAVIRVLNGDFYLERRMMLETCVWRDATCVHRSIGLNDAGIGKGSFARMIGVKIYVDDNLYDEFSGDGVIVSTPTGSTAYSLSCGGPIVLPHMQVIILTPICAHKLVARPCVIGAEQKVRVNVTASHSDLGLTVDGQVGFPLQSGDDVVVTRAASETILVRWQERAFFSILQSKLRGD